MSASATETIIPPTAEAWARAEQWSARFDADPTFGRAPLDHAFIARPLTESWARLAAERPDDLAVTDGVLALSHRRMVTLTHRIAAAISQAAVPEGPIALLMPDSALCAAAMFAGLIAGRVLLILDTVSPAARNAEILRQGGARLVLIGRPDDPTARAAEGFPTLSITSEDTLPDATPWDGRDRLGQDAPAFVLTTSGSTGRPKLVAYSQRLMAHRTGQFASALGLVAGDRALTGSGSLSTYIGFGYLCAALAIGASTHIASVRRLGIRGLFERMRADRVTALRVPPSLMRTLATASGAADAFRHVRTLRLTSEPLTWDDVETVRPLVGPACQITNSYGSTEAGSFNRIIGSRPDSAVTSVSAGIPQAGLTAVIAREDGSPAEPDEAGELFIRGPFCALGEYEAGKVVLGRLLAADDGSGDRIYPTGDLAYQTPEGDFVILGRKDRMLKINGLRVEPIEVEAAIRATGQVHDVVVLPRVVGEATTLIAFVERSEPAPDGFEEGLRAELRGRLPAYMVPTRIVVLAELPRLPGGKADGVSLMAGVS